MFLLQLVVSLIVTFVALLLLARVGSLLGGIGRFELAILLAPATLLGVWAGRRFRRAMSRFLAF